MPKGKMALREILKGDLLIQLNEVWRKGESYQDNQKGDNIQGTLHCKAVETNLCKLIPDDKKEKELSQTELFVLSAAACLHDIGKVVNDDAKGWKSDHGKRSMEIILKEYDKLGLDKGQKPLIEIIHDYLGKIVDEELVKEEDRTIKFLEEQLNAFYQNYKMHGTPIMDPIFMVHLYRNRRKIRITEEKYPLILCTCLYKKVGLGWYWHFETNQEQAPF